MLDSILQISGTAKGTGIMTPIEAAAVNIDSGFTAALALEEVAPAIEPELAQSIEEMQNQYAAQVNNFAALAEVQEFSFPIEDDIARAELDVDTLAEEGIESPLPQIAEPVQKQQLAAMKPEPLAAIEIQSIQAPEEVALASIIEFPNTEAMLAYEANLDKIQLASIQPKEDIKTVAPAMIQVAQKVIDIGPDPKPKLVSQELEMDETRVETESGIEVVSLPVEVEVDAQEVELRNYSASHPEKNLVPAVAARGQIAIESFYTGAQKSYDRQIADKVVDQVQYQVTKAFDGNNESIRFTLSPQNLGEVEIRFDTEQKNGHTNISVLAERYGTMNILDQITSQIETSLIDSGFKPENFTLNFGMQDSGKGQEKFMQAQSQATHNEPEIVNYITNYSGYLFSSTDTINILV